MIESTNTKIKGCFDCFWEKTDCIKEIDLCKNDYDINITINYPECCHFKKEKETIILPMDLYDFIQDNKIEFY